MNIKEQGGDHKEVTRNSLCGDSIDESGLVEQLIKGSMIFTEGILSNSFLRVVNRSPIV